MPALNLAKHGGADHARNPQPRSEVLHLARHGTALPERNRELMPLFAQIEDEGGNPLPLRWGWWHTQIMRLTAALETDSNLDPDAPDEVWYPVYEKSRLYTHGEVVLTRDYFWCDPADGEKLQLRIGMTLRLWSSR